MKITVSQEKLSRALNNVSRIAMNKVTLPILNNVLIRVTDKKVSLVTTNLDMAVKDYLPVSSSEDGVITVPAKLLAEFISNLPRGEKITLESSDTKITITAGQYSSIINGSLADEFPELPELNPDSTVVFSLNPEEFKNSVTSVIIASSNDLSRPALTGVLFNTVDGQLAIAATDGYRLAEKILIEKIESEIRAIVPASTLHEVLRSFSDDLESIEIAFSEDLVRFRLGEVEIISKLIDASYPDYRKLIPKESKVSATVNTDELIRVTKLAALFARAVGGSIVCEIIQPDTLSVRSIANEYGQNDSRITAENLTANGHINLSSRFLLDALNSLGSSSLTLGFTNSSSPIILKPIGDTTYTHIIMPLNN